MVHFTNYKFRQVGSDHFAVALRQFLHYFDLLSVDLPPFPGRGRVLNLCVSACGVRVITLYGIGNERPEFDSHHQSTTVCQEGIVN